MKLCSSYGYSLSALLLWIGGTAGQGNGNGNGNGNSPECVDLQLDMAWSVGGLYDCNHYVSISTAYCAQTAIEQACCGCGGGDSSGSTPAPVPTCTDGELPIEWTVGGQFDCSYYATNGGYHDGVFYCLHADINEMCCFCGGGGDAANTPSAPSPTNPASANSCDYGSCTATPGSNLSTLISGNDTPCSDGFKLGDNGVTTPTFPDTTFEHSWQNSITGTACIITLNNIK